MKRIITLFMCMGFLCNSFAQMPPQGIIPEVNKNGDNIVFSKSTLNTNCDSSVALVEEPNFECGYNFYWDVKFTGVTKGAFAGATTDARFETFEPKPINTYQSIVLNSKLFNSELIDNTIGLSFSDQLFKLNLRASGTNSNLFLPIPKINPSKDDPMVSSDILTD